MIFRITHLIECELAFEGDTPVGLVTYYWTYATFRAARRLYLEDLFVLPAARGRGYGKALLTHLARSRGWRRARNRRAGMAMLLEQIRG